MPLRKQQFKLIRFKIFDHPNRRVSKFFLFLTLISMLPLMAQANETIDFKNCQKHDARRVYTALGSTTYAINGLSGDKCEMHYGGEIENPAWSGKLDATCFIPSQLGSVTFVVTETGIDFDPISSYCE